MNIIIYLLKGAAIGLANIVAGLSGATIAVLCNVYDDLINACSSIFRHPIRTIKKYYILFVGIVLGLVIGIIIFDKLYEVAPLPVSLFFSGLIITSIPMIYNKIDKKIKSNNMLNYFLFFTSFAVILALPFLTSSVSNNLDFNFLNMLILLVLGFIAAASMIVPGISGSMILASLGYYENFLSLLSDTMKALISFDFPILLQNGTLILFFLLGALIGIVLIAKFIKILFSKYNNQSYFMILGLIIASSISILVVVFKADNYFNEKTDIIMILLGIFTFIGGILMGLFFNKFSKKNKINFLKEAELYL
ncbi:MAG: DUF368 domain-containing protein, partial [Anaeroplasmataceae bacterium]